MAKQRILLVDDHEVVRLGLRALLERHPHFEVIAEASTAREAIERVKQYSPDVVVMDIRLPGGSGIEACEEITENYPDSKVIMLTSYAEDEMLFSAIRAGAAGYVLKQIGGEDLVKAIEAVGLGGETWSRPSRQLAVAKRYSIQPSPSVYSRKSAKQPKKKKHRLSPRLRSRRSMSWSWFPKGKQIAKLPKLYFWEKAPSAIMSAVSYRNWG